MFVVPKPQQNYLLAALPAPALERLLPHLEPVELSLGEVLYESGGALGMSTSPLTPSCRCCT